MITLSYSVINIIILVGSILNHPRGERVVYLLKYCKFMMIWGWFVVKVEPLTTNPNVAFYYGLLWGRQIRNLLPIGRVGHDTSHTIFTTHRRDPDHTYIHPRLTYVHKANESRLLLLRRQMDCSLYGILYNSAKLCSCRDKDRIPWLKQFSETRVLICT